MKQRQWQLRNNCTTNQWWPSMAAEEESAERKVEREQRKNIRKTIKLIDGNLYATRTQKKSEKIKRRQRKRESETHTKSQKFYGRKLELQSFSHRASKSKPLKRRSVLEKWRRGAAGSINSATNETTLKEFHHRQHLTNWHCRGTKCVLIHCETKFVIASRIRPVWRLYWRSSVINSYFSTFYLELNFGFSFNGF